VSELFSLVSFLMGCRLRDAGARGCCVFRFGGSDFIGSARVGGGWWVRGGWVCLRCRTVVVGVGDFGWSEAKRGDDRPPFSDPVVAYVWRVRRADWGWMVFARR